MPADGRARHLAGAGVVLLVWVACGGTAFREYVLREPESIRLECEDVDAAREITFVGAVAFTSVDDRRPRDMRGRVGELPDRGAELRFDPGTSVPDRLGRDLERRFADRGIQFIRFPDVEAGSIRLEVLLLVAEAALDTSLVGSEGVVGRFGFTLEVYREGDTAPLWFTRVEGRHAEAPLYTTSRTYEAAINGAYCAALEEASAWLGTDSFQEALDVIRSGGD